MDIIKYDAEVIPDEIKIQVAKLMREYRLERTDWPVNDQAYFEQFITQMTDDVGGLFEIAEDKGQVRGYAFLEYRRNEINDTSYGTLRIFVAADFRRQGVASALVGAMLKHLPPQIKTLRVSIEENHPIFNVFQQKSGKEPDFMIRLNVSKIREIDTQWLEQEINAELPQLEEMGYSLHYLDTDHYPLDDPKYAELMEEIWNANSGKNTNKKPEKFPVSRVRGRYEWVRDQKGVIHTTAARHESGTWVGLTEIFTYETNPQLGEQSLTGVMKQHRRKGLGYLLKLMNMRTILERTEVTHVLTGNADKNDPILKINDKLKFQPAVIYGIFEMQADELERMVTPVIYD